MTTLDTLLDYNNISNDDLIDIYINASDEKFEAYLKERKISINIRETVFELRSRNRFSKDVIKFKHEISWYEFYRRMITFQKLVNKSSINTELADHYVQSQKLMELKILYKLHKVLPSIKGANYCARVGNLFILEWLAKHRVFPDVSGANNAAKYEFIHILDWLKEQNIFPHRDIIIISAIKKGQIKILEWYAKQNILPNVETSENFEHACHYAVSYDQIESLKFLIKHNIYPTSADADTAVTESSIDIMNFLVSIGVLPSSQALKDAINCDDIELVEWMKKQGVCL